MHQLYCKWNERYPFFDGERILKGAIDEYDQICKEGYSERKTAEIMFHYLYRAGSPFDGRESFLQKFYSIEEQEKYYNENAIFCFHNKNHRNRPVPGLQDELLEHAKRYPDYVKEYFQQIFDQKEKKTDFSELVIHMRRDYKVCHCGYQSFLKDYLWTKDQKMICPRCQSVFYSFTDGKKTIYLGPESKIYEFQLLDTKEDKIWGRVVENSMRKGVYGIKNVSEDTWTAVFPDQSKREVPPGKVAPVWKKLHIVFKDEIQFHI